MKTIKIFFQVVLILVLSCSMALSNSMNDVSTTPAGIPGTFITSYEDDNGDCRCIYMIDIYHTFNMSGEWTISVSSLSNTALFSPDSAVIDSSINTHIPLLVEFDCGLSLNITFEHIATGSLFSTGFSPGSDLDNDGEPDYCCVDTDGDGTNDCDDCAPDDPSMNIDCNYTEEDCYNPCDPSCIDYEPCVCDPSSCGYSSDCYDPCDPACMNYDECACDPASCEPPVDDCYDPCNPDCLDYDECACSYDPCNIACDYYDECACDPASCEPPIDDCYDPCNPDCLDYDECACSYNPCNTACDYYDECACDPASCEQPIDNCSYPCDPACPDYQECECNPDPCNTACSSYDECACDPTSCSMEPECDIYATNVSHESAIIQGNLMVKVTFKGENYNPGPSGEFIVNVNNSNGNHSYGTLVTVLKPVSSGATSVQVEIQDADDSECIYTVVVDLSDSSSSESKPCKDPCDPSCTNYDECACNPVSCGQSSQYDEVGHMVDANMTHNRKDGKVSDHYYISEIQKSSSTKIFPNPVQDELVVHTIDWNNGTIAIIDALGRLVFRIEHIKDVQKLDVSDLSPGRYMVELQSNDGDRKFHALIK